MSKEYEYEIKSELLNILKMCRDDDYECGIRGWVRPDSPSQHSSWAIHLNKPWRISEEDEKRVEKLKETNDIRAEFESSTTVYTSIDDGVSSWDKEGLENFRNAVNEVLEIWDDLDEQEKNNR